jgi:hypothetical protein
MREIALLIATAWIALPAWAEEERLPIQPGQWKVTTEVSVSLAPRPRVRDNIQCVTAEDLRAVELTGSSDLCDNEQIRVSGDTMTWKIRCREQMKENSGEGHVTMSDGEFSGQMQLHGAPRKEGDPIVVTTTWKGQRLGDCE